MGFVDKLKDWFSDEEEVPIKSEKTQVKIALPEQTEKEEITDCEVLTAPEKTAPIFFSDEDFQEIPEKEISKKKYAFKIKKEEEKIFRPTPIISPVYGILDKNYSKEQITDKKKDVGTGKYDYENTREYDIDRIRKKAFGTLDDDLEQELLHQKHVLVDEDFVEEKDLFDEMEEKVEETKEVVEENEMVADENLDVETKEIEIGEALEPEKDLEADLFPDAEDEKFLDKDVYEEETDNEDNCDVGNDNLFNLIDTMYEKGD